MQKKPVFSLKQWLPYIVAIVLFVAITLVYFYPALEGKLLSAGDMINFKGMSKEIVDFRKETGQEALWTNGMFGGMPAYQISTVYKLNLTRYADEVLRLGFDTPIGQVLVYFFGFFILLLVLRVNPWISLSGAIAFAFSSYFFIILGAGHNSKAAAIGFMAPVIAGVIMAYRGRYISGAIITSFFLALQIYSGHPQITYYLLIMVVCYGVAEFIQNLRNKSLPHFFKATGLLMAAAILAVLTHTASLWNTYEYSKYTIRSQSELSHDQDNRTTGLDKDYVTSWSYGIPETMTLLVPNFAGGSSHIAVGKNSETAKILRQNRVPNTDQIIRSLPMYWGPQPFTSGPVYVGAIVVFLFIFSLFILKGPLKWWGAAVVLLSIFLAWGKHFMFLTDFFLDYIPLYNKFRTVSMILVIAELVMPLMAILALDQVMKQEVSRKDLLKYLKYTTVITGAILLLLILFSGSMFNFSSMNDARSGLPDWLLDAIRQDRHSMLRNDAIRSLIFILLAAGILWLWALGKIKKSYVLVAFPILFLADMWPVDKRFLSNDDFTRKSSIEKPFPITKADQAILEDKDISYRVYNMGEAFDQSARTSYFHKNIGGYHGAKFRRYQELVDFHLSPERTRLVDALTNNPTNESINAALKSLNAFNMLNTKYLIYNNDAEPLLNPYALGNAWFVSGYQLAENADQEIGALGSIDPGQTAVIDRRYAGMLEGFSGPDSVTGRITLTSYQPNHLTYEYSAENDQLAVFSEIYYDKGWNAYIDGEKKPHFRADYTLRAMILPAGAHRLEFRFEPVSFYAGEKVSLASSLIVLLLVIGLIVKYLMGSKTGQ